MKQIDVFTFLHSPAATLDLQIFKNLNQTIRILAATVNYFQRCIKYDMCGKFNSSLPFLIMNRV